MGPPRTQITRLEALGGATLLAGLTLLAYLPCLDGEFIWDDESLITQNELIHAPDGLRRMWFTTDPIDYWPLTNTSFWIEWRLWGMNSTGYHVANLALHIASSLLIWAILGRLAIPGAFLAALLFAVHPVNVESVAWIAQRKNTLSMLFFLLSILWYLKADTAARRSAAFVPSSGRGERSRRSRGWYWLSLLAFTLAMLGKGSVAILPLVLLLIGWWQRGSITRQDLLRTAPFFLVAVALTAVNVWFQSIGPDDAPIRTVTPLERLLGAGAVVWFYMYKALVPINLAFVYPQWNISAGDWRWWAPLVAAGAVTAVLTWNRASWWGRPLLLAWLFFCVALLPVMGLTDVYFMKYSLVADHYQYIALVGVVALVAAGWKFLYKRAADAARSAILVLAVLAVAGFTFLSHQQSKVYADAVTLYQDTLKKNPDSWMAHNNLGAALVKAGRAQEAVAHFEQALLLNPDNIKAHQNLADELLKAGQLREALAHYLQALQLTPNDAAAHNDVGLALSRLGRRQEAVEHYRQALKLKPGFPPAHNNLGNVLAEEGRLQEAIDHFEQALRSSPNDVEALNNLGLTLLQAGWPDRAVQQYERALALKPDYVEIHFNLAMALARGNHPDRAIAEAQKALELARATGNTNMAQQTQSWIESFRARQSNDSITSPQRDAQPPSK